MKKLFRTIVAVMKDAFAGFSEHNAARMGASLSYYTVFSIGPLLLIAIAVAGMVFGREAAQNEVFDTLKGFLGASGADVVQNAVQSASKKSSSILATIVSVALLLVTASGVFAELHTAMNDMWGVKLKKSTIWRAVRSRFLSMTMVFGVAFLLLVSLLISTVLGVVGKWLSETLPGGETLWQIINFGISLAIIAVLFAAMFKYVPDLRMRWREAFIGGAVTSLLFTLGKLGISLYISKGDVGSGYGAAGSLIVLLIWVYYSSQIVFFGAEICRAIVVAREAPVRPARMAESVQPQVITEDEKKKKNEYMGPHPPWPRPT